MEANEMQPRTRNKGREALQEFQRGHHEMGGPIPVRGFELEDNLAGLGTTQAFVAQGGARDVAAQPFEFLSLMGTTAGVACRLNPCALTQP